MRWTAITLAFLAGLALGSFVGAWLAAPTFNVATKTSIPT